MKGPLLCEFCADCNSAIAFIRPCVGDGVVVAVVGVFIGVFGVSVACYLVNSLVGFGNSLCMYVDLY